MESQNLLWWQRGIIYNLYVRSFKDSNGDGIGDLPGVVSQLDYLCDTLGIDILYLSGMLMSPWAEYGFDISDFKDIHPAFGGMLAFEDLLEKAHQRGLKVMIDYVPNHTSSQHPWFIDAKSSRQSPKHDWYLWTEPKPDGTPLNNWLSLFGGPAWEWEEDSWQYYQHTFLKEQPDLNWRNPQVQQAMFDVIRFWLEKGVDGFRVDAAHHIFKDPQLRDNPPNPEPRTLWGKRFAHEYQQHIYDREQPEVHGVLRQFRQILDEYSTDQPRAAFTEIHVKNWQEWAKYYGENLDEMHFPLNNGLATIDWKAQKVREVVDTMEQVMPEGAWPNAHTGNFDEHRVIRRYGEGAARIAAMLLLTLRGTPMLYYGEEIGMTNVEILPEHYRDPFGRRVGLSRDPQRTPMQWSPEPQAGFSPPETTSTWLPVHPNHQNVNVQTELEEPHSILNLYRRLIELRRQNSVLVSGTYQPVGGVPEDCFVYDRQDENSRMLVALNFSEQPQQLDLASFDQATILLSTHLDREGDVAPGHLELRGNEGLLLSV